MDLFHDVFSSRMCSVEGSTSQNPLNLLIDNILDHPMLASASSISSMGMIDEETMLLSSPEHEHGDLIHPASAASVAAAEHEMRMMQQQLLSDVMTSQAQYYQNMQQYDEIWSSSASQTQNMMNSQLQHAHTHADMMNMNMMMNGNIFQYPHQQQHPMHMPMHYHSPRYDQPSYEYEQYEERKVEWEQQRDAEADDHYHDPLHDTAYESYEEYKFDPASSTLADNIHESVDTLIEQGRTTEAIACLERQVKEDQENAEAWVQLGRCHAENDDDTKAIACFKRALEADPYNLDALLHMGTSHVNELNPSDALAALQSWIQQHPAFYGLKAELDEFSDGSVMDEVFQLLLKAHEHDPQNVDVLTLLGIFYNVSQDYESAVRYFKQALASSTSSSTSSQNYALLNKIGATLANNGQSQEAIPYYIQALTSRPSYTRGWLNLAISCVNLEKYESAIHAYLKALSQCPSAKHIWSYLRKALIDFKRPDLIELCSHENPKYIWNALHVTPEQIDANLFTLDMLK